MKKRLAAILFVLYPLARRRRRLLCARVVATST
jgi:hypothetical protein